MTRVKLLVFLFYLNVVFALCHNYCEICRNHTLCKFPVAGPSPSCVKYDGARLLTQEDIESIVNKINDRRNFIALSRSKYLPGAANMRKVVWSHELAEFAQRWADQCDPSTRPDKEDDCRNLETGEVGQNIATMSDLSPAFNVKSFVEMWFMQSLDYSGSVTFYNQVDNRTKYFTQLIWANTDIVGCGQASFKVENLRLTLRRLVCNFAPRGNILGKPVYTIGYAATQCPANMVPDINYKGLCTFRDNEKQMTQTSPVSSLLRIINLSDSPEILNNQTSKNNESSQMGQSIFINKTHAAVKRYPHNFWSKTFNHSKPNENHLKKDEEDDEDHQRLNHIIGPQNYLHAINKNTDLIFNKHEGETTPIVLYSNPNYKNKQLSSCTRKAKILRNNCDNTDQDDFKCTRSQHDSKIKLTSPESAQNPFTCPCDFYTTPSTTTENHQISNINCPCLNKNNMKMLCSNFRRQEEKSFSADAEHKSSTFYYYDLLPNLHVRQQMRRENLQNKFSTYQLPNENGNLDGLYRRKGFVQHYRDRQKRDGKQHTTTKPFWKMDDTLIKMTLQPKAARYTTIANRKIKHTLGTTKGKSTESITVSLIPITSTFLNKQSIITEKYLSFDELMQLRKLNIGGEHESRRKGAESTTKAKSTTIEITANTPFIRMKHCTRKLTCTWTVPKFTDCNGSVIADNDGSNRGSRTPPGYVDGCTRTSTCTRDYMDRNKKASTTDELTDMSSSTSEGDDDDYCERRSLKIKRRNSNEEIKTTNYDFITLDLTTISPKNTVEYIPNVDKSNPKNNNDCMCYDLTNQERDKRNYILNSKEYGRYHKKHNKKKIYYEEMHYGELYFKILGKLKETWEKSKKRNRLGRCFCNGSSSCQNKVILLFLFICTRFTR